MKNPFVLTNVTTNPQTKELFFTVNEKSKYKIPSKLFPLSSKKEVGLFTTDSTVPFEHEAFFEALDTLDLPIGRCYSNSQKILEVGKNLNLDIFYLSGWLFSPNAMPKHHAWIVIEHEQGVSVVDSFKYHLFSKAEELNTIDYLKPNWRKESGVGIKKALKLLPLNHQQICIGKVVPQAFYVGSPDTIDNARFLFQLLTKQFPNHPSYQGEGDSMTGRSKFQEEMHRQGLE